MNAEQIEQCAADWFEKRLSGQWSEVDERALQTWLAASLAHEIQYLRIESAWQQLARLKAVGAGVPADKVPPRHSWGDVRFFRGTTPLPQNIQTAPPSSVQKPLKAAGARSLFAVAAALVAAVGGAYLYQTHAGIDQYTTPVGGLQNLSLQDGSHITLNTDTRLRASVGAHERRVELIRGEAFFDVAKDVQRPFVVEAGDRRIVVVGTQFSVRREGEEVRVVVTEGKVRIEKTQGATGGRTDAPLLTAGAVVQASRTNMQVREEGGAHVEKLLSWRSGYVNFENVPLTEAVAEFNRYRESKILIEDPSIEALRIGGNFRSSSSEAFLAVLESGFAIDVQRRDGGIVLKGRH